MQWVMLSNGWIGVASEPEDARTRYAVMLCRLHLLIAGGENPPEAEALRDEMTACAVLLDGPVIDEMHRLSAAIRRALITPPPLPVNVEEIEQALASMGTGRAGEVGGLLSMSRALVDEVKIAIADRQRADRSCEEMRQELDAAMKEVTRLTKEPKQSAAWPGKIPLPTAKQVTNFQRVVNRFLPTVWPGRKRRDK